MSCRCVEMVFLGHGSNDEHGDIVAFYWCWKCGSIEKRTYFDNGEAESTYFPVGQAPEGL